MTHIGETLRAARESKGMSREQVSLRCHLLGRPVHANSIYRLETDPERSTGIGIIESVACSLGLRLVLESKRRKR